MQTISVYMNQRASNTGLEFWKNRIGSALFRSDLKFRQPENLTDLRDQLNQDIEAQVDTVVSVGGDGTVNTLIQQLADTDIGLLVIPGGTANDLAHELGLEKNVKKVIQYVRQKNVKQIDLIKVNQRLFATNGGFGLGGEVANRINEMRKRYPKFKDLMKLTGKKIYSLFVAQEMLSLNSKMYHLNIKSNEMNGQFHCHALLINNQPVIAGTFHVAPKTKNDDGKFNVTILTHKNKFDLVRALIQVAQGIPVEGDPHFISFETDSLVVENLEKNKPISFFGDGEVFEEHDQVWNISIKPQSLKVYSRDSAVDMVDLVNEVQLS